MRLLFFGYQAVGSACLKTLLDKCPGAEVTAVVTHEDDPDEEIWFEPPAQIALGAGIEVMTPSREELKGKEFLRKVRRLRPELLLSCYYRYMIPSRVLNAAPLGGLNMHGSYLPEYRGRCPVNWQVLHGATRGGVTLHRMLAAPDAGEIVAQRAVPIGPRDTAFDVYRKLVPAAAELLRATWPRIAAGDLRGAPQDESMATYFGGRRPEDGLIDWPGGAEAADRLVRAVAHPWPGAFTFFRGRKLFLWQAEPGRGDKTRKPGEATVAAGSILVHDGRGAALRLLRLQLEGEGELGAAEFLSHHPDIEGSILGGLP